MKFSAASMFLATVVSFADASSGSLRAISSTISQQQEPRAESLHMKGDSSHRILEGEASQDKKKEATRDKYEKVKARSMPSYKLTPKDDVPIESTLLQQEARLNNTDFGINIVGGEVSDSGEFPYYVDMDGCGGTLIGPSVVLGAAHCGTSIGDTVKIGNVRVQVIQERRHPNYNSNTDENDFFLYRLKTPVTTTGASVRVNTQASLPLPGQDMTTLGLGLTSDGGRPSAVLRDVVVRSVSNADCTNAYGSDFRAAVMLCAGAPGKDACQGDSGGPIVIRNGLDHVLTGVVSFGEGCADADYPGVYARVSSVVSWISTVACTEWSVSVNGLCSAGSSPVPPPAPAPASKPTAAPVRLPTAAPVTPATCTTLTVRFRTDSWPEENVIVLEGTRGSIWDYSGFAENSDYSFSTCVPNAGCTILDVTDTEGDGLLDDGFIKVTYGSRVLYNDWDIGEGFLVYLGDRC